MTYKSLTSDKPMGVKIADFGLAINILEQPSKLERCGSPGYVAPEILKNGTAFPQSDIFSFGCLMFNALTGVQLF